MLISTEFAQKLPDLLQWLLCNQSWSKGARNLQDRSRHDKRWESTYRAFQFQIIEGDGIRINVDGVPIFTGSDAFHRLIIRHLRNVFESKRFRGKIIVCLNGGKEPKASRKKPNVIMCRSQDFFQPVRFSFDVSIEWPISGYRGKGRYRFCLHQLLRK